jgi:uncharacterized protein YehS (DUF1456 family)
MTGNDLLRRLRYALDLDDDTVRRLFALGGVELGPDRLAAYLARDRDADHVLVPTADLSAFLDGLVLERRGPRDPSAPARAKEELLDNNGVLKKLRVALELKEGDLIALLRAGGLDLSASELGALFRKPGHKHYRPAGDQLMRAFLTGLTARLRGPRPSADEP